MPALHFPASQVLDDIRTFLQDEFSTLRRQFAERRALPVPERVEHGTCLNGLIFVEIDHQGRVRFRHRGNDSRLREGDAVRLSHPETDSTWEAFIFREEAETLSKTA